MSIYVEIRIRARWTRSGAHADARAPRALGPPLHRHRVPAAARRRRAAAVPLRHAIGFGLAGRRRGRDRRRARPAGRRRTSALKFWSEDPRSIIREGTGYWKYVPTPDGIRFLTCYDYRTRFGRAGRSFDRLVFRPLIGWATAWSFDRLRLWLERGVDPRGAPADRWSTRRALALALVFAYHGLVPKLLSPTPTSSPCSATPASRRELPAAPRRLGIAELAVRARPAGRLAHRLLAGVCLAWSLLVGAALVGARPRRATSAAAFNPVTLNLASLPSPRSTSWTCRPAVRGACLPRVPRRRPA